MFVSDLEKHEPDSWQEKKQDWFDLWGYVWQVDENAPFKWISTLTFLQSCNFFFFLLKKKRKGVLGGDWSHNLNWLKPGRMGLRRIESRVGYPNNLVVSSHSISHWSAPEGFQILLTSSWPVLSSLCFCWKWDLHLTSPLSNFHSSPPIATLSSQSNPLILELRFTMKHEATEGVFGHPTYLSEAHRAPFGELLFVHVASECRGWASDLLADHTIDAVLSSTHKKFDYLFITVKWRQRQQWSPVSVICWDLRFRHGGSIDRNKLATYFM